MINTNTIFDVVIIGASQDGIEAAEQLTKKYPKIQTLLISTNFTKLDLETTKLNTLKAKVVFSEFNHGLIGLSLTSSDVKKVYCKNVIIATGTSAIKLKNMKKELLTMDNIYYKLQDIPKSKLSKNNQVIIIGNSQEAVKAALTLSTKVTYVYLCSKYPKLACDEHLAGQLILTENIAYLPSSTVVGFRANESGTITSLTLDTYSKIHCTSVLVLLGQQIDESGITPHMAAVNEKQQIIVDKNCKTTIVPNIYAIGSCSTRPTKAAQLRMLDTIAKENNWK